MKKIIIFLFGIRSELFETIIQKEFIKPENYNDMINILQNSKYGQFTKIVISENNILETACNLCKDTEFGCIKFVDSETLSKGNRSKLLHNIINDMLKVQTSTIILYIVENIIKFNPLISYCDNDTLQVIYMLLNKIYQ